MSYEIIATEDLEPETRSRDPWPEGQVYVGGDADATRRLWDTWTDEDACPLVYRQYIKVNPEYAEWQKKRIDNSTTGTSKESFPRGRFSLPDKFYRYTNNVYARGGIAWCATCLHVARKMGHEPPLIVFETSDFDTVGCTLNTLESSKTPNFPDVPDHEKDDVDDFLWYKEETGAIPKKNVREAWPGRYRYSRGLGSEIVFDPYDVKDVTNYKTSCSGFCSPQLFWGRLASFFDNRLTLNDKKLTEDEIKKTSMDRIADEYGVDASDDRHERGNLAALPARYGLDDSVPYLMRVKGFGFVETPTIQVGQIIDTLSDYTRCADQYANGIKGKYRRRLTRLAHSLKIHEALVGERYAHGPDSPTDKTSPFVLSDVVANELRNFARSKRWEGFLEATDPKIENCRRVARVDEGKKEVVMGEEIACEHEDARMNCKRMMGHPFVNRDKLRLKFASYDKQDRWQVRLPEEVDAIPLPAKRDRKNI